MERFGGGHGGTFMMTRLDHQNSSPVYITLLYIETVEKQKTPWTSERYCPLNGCRDPNVPIILLLPIDPFAVVPDSWVGAPQPSCWICSSSEFYIRFWPVKRESETLPYSTPSGIWHSWTYRSTPYAHWYHVSLGLSSSSTVCMIARIHCQPAHCRPDTQPTTSTGLA